MANFVWRVIIDSVKLTHAVEPMY